MLVFWGITIRASMTVNCLLYAHGKPNFEVLTLEPNVLQPLGDFPECQLHDLYNSIA